MEGVEPSTVALLAQRSNQLSYTTFLSTIEYMFHLWIAEGQQY